MRRLRRTGTPALRGLQSRVLRGSHRAPLCDGLLLLLRRMPGTPGAAVYPAAAEEARQARRPTVTASVTHWPGLKLMFDYPHWPAGFSSVRFKHAIDAHPRYPHQYRADNRGTPATNGEPGHDVANQQQHTAIQHQQE
jgi:hypothetical protein